MIKTMEFNEICGDFTKTWVKKHSEYIREYKGYSIVFGAFERTENGTFWRISLYRNNGKRMEIEYRSAGLWACDAQAMSIEMKLAKDFIDKLERKN